MNELELMVQKRDEIQFLDEQILSLLEKRVEAAKVIGNIKKKSDFGMLCQKCILNII